MYIQTESYKIGVANGQHIRSIKAANIAGVADAPAGFVEWAMANGAVNQPSAEQ